jgi:hypothetical protein
MSSFLDALGGVNWREYQYYLMDGNPPLYIQLLVVNGFFLALWFYRRIRAPHAVRQASAIVLQAAFVLANVGVIIAGQMWS